MGFSQATLSTTSRVELWEGSFESFKGQPLEVFERAGAKEENHEVSTSASWNSCLNLCFPSLLVPNSLSRRTAEPCSPNRWLNIS